MMNTQDALQLALKRIISVLPTDKQRHDIQQNYFCNATLDKAAHTLNKYGSEGQVS
jgi:hypothetical protein